MEWSQAAWSVWGKLSPDSASWMPLVRHLEDTSGVAGYLWDEFLPAATRRYICEELDISDDQGKALARWLAGIHDIGKASPAFAAKAQGAQMPGILDVMRDYGLDARSTPEDRCAPHATAGQVIFESWLAEQFPNSTRRARNTYTGVVGCHHGSTPAIATVEVARLHPAQIGGGAWAEVRAEMLGRMAVEAGADGYLGAWLTKQLPLPVQVLLSGLVIMADWIASNTDYFPHWSVLSGVEGESSQTRLQAAIEQLALPSPWMPTVPTMPIDDFLWSRFPHLVGQQTRRLQERLVAAAREIESPSLFIVEGPMGVGKTEAALLAAEVLVARFGLGGVFVGLPTMATANPMFDRVLHWLNHALSGGDASVALAHGKAALNQGYRDLLRNRWAGQVYDDEEGASAVVNSWLRGRKRAGLASFVVGTIDQSLFAALKAKHVVLRHLGLAGKVVIIDEVHAADDYMREYLKCLLGWLGAYRTPVILMSATLPPAQREELLAAYSNGIPVESDDLTDAYPRISVSGAGVRLPRLLDPIAADVRELRIGLRCLPDDLAILVASLSEALAEGGCAGVVCNTVTRAQDAFTALRDAFGDDVRLVHSRFVATDRAIKESEIVGLLGPNAETRPQRLVVVGTQVLEQSLDVDFDLLVSDMAPIDLMLQRAGRLHRHQRGWRPTAVATPAYWIRGVTDWGDAPPRFVQGSKAVYKASRLLRAASVLSGVTELCFPSDIPRLVRLGYDPQAVPPPGWEDAWSGGEDRASNYRATSISHAQTYLMESPRKKSSLNGLIDLVGTDPEKWEEQGKSQVRDSGEGLEVMALWRGEDTFLHLPPSHPFRSQVITEAIQWGPGADEDLARMMAECTIRLPATLCYPSIIDQVITELEAMADYSGWQQSRWISGQLAIVFDSAGCCQLAGRELTYDPERGLQITRA
jgi:CRISPR-associated endonuclease/helicase Cas3